MNDEWELWVDGSGNSSTQPCAAGYVTVLNGKVVDQGGVYLGEGSNNVAEIRAIGCGLRSIMKIETEAGKKPSEVRELTNVRVYSDSEFAIGAVHPLSTWNISASETLRDLVLTARKELSRWKSVALRHVEGHSGHPHNERADQLAGAARKAEHDVTDIPVQPEKKRGKRKTDLLPPETEIPLVFVDTETSGLDAKKHQMIQLAAIITDTEQKKIDAFETKILMDPNKVLDPRTVEVHGHDPRDPAWQATAIPMKQAIYAFAARLPPYFRLVAHQVDFDRRFLLAGYAMAGLATPKMHPEPICTVKLARKFQHDEKLENVKLGTLCGHFGVENTRAHDALGDLDALFQLYPLLVARAAAVR